jgi:hypothetical protein
MEQWSVGVMVKMEGATFPILQYSITPKNIAELFA